MYYSITFGFLAVIFTIWLIWRKRRMTFLQRYGIPGPKPSFWTGNLNDFNQNKGDCIMEWRKKYGKIFGFYLGAHPKIIVCDVELLRMILVKEFKNFINRDPLLPDTGMPHPAMQQTIFALRDDKWKNIRSIISPAFTSGKLRKMMPTIQAGTEIFLKKVAEKENKSFDIVPLFKNLSFDLIGKISFGIDTNIQNNNSNLFVESVYNIFHTTTSDFSAFLSMCFPELEPIPCMIRTFKDILKYYTNKPSFRTIFATCTAMVKRRKYFPEERKPDMLQNLIDASISSDSLEDGNEDGIKKENKLLTLSDFLVVANSMGFMVAGYEGTRLILGYAAHLLALNQEVQETLRDEIKKIVGDKDHITYEDIGNMQYLDQVFLEVLRLTPFGPLSDNRIAAEEFKYKDVTIPKGVTVLIPITILNTDPEYWKNPTKFDPERFSQENKDNIDIVQFQPFGLGPRICIAVRFAHVVIKQILINLLRKYKLEYTGKSKELELEYSMFNVRPKHGIFVRAIPI